MDEFSPNSTLSHYRIISKLGAGGMGEVYRARDTRLDREVAIKILPAKLSGDGDRLKRFEQEARATSTLNHPNILTVYDIGMHEGAPYLVAELLQGEELRHQLKGTAKSERKAIDYAQQIVHGLAAAHERGIVHRDLKPENLFITTDGRAKILDFGLAKLTAASTEPDISEDSTRRVLTNPGTIIGTVDYMSPEQVRGEKVDHRSDIFTFGAILHEMITGRRAFRRETMAETMTAILKEEPEELSTLNPNTSPALERIVNRCLEKKPERRFQSTSDLGFALDALSAPTSSSGRDLTTAASVAVTEAKRSTWHARLPWVVAGTLALALLTFGAFSFSSRSSNEARAVRLWLIPPPDVAFNDATANAAVISPDGQKIAFTANSVDGKIMLYIRNLDSLEAKVLPGSENAIEPFWSPDSRSIGFGSNGKLKRADLSGANAAVVCDAARLVGGTWNEKGTIVFAPDYGTALMQVSAQGGEPRLAIAKSTVEPEGERYPYFLPDDRHFLFQSEQAGIVAASLDSSEVKQILPDKTRFVYATQGFLIFLRNEALVAQSFDARSLTLSGDPVPIITGQKIQHDSNRISVSTGGILVWQPQWEREYQLVWFDREGKQIGTVEAPLKVFVGEDPYLSPDGRRLVIRRDNNLWVVDLEKGTGLRITSTFSQAPLWSPDGSRILYNGGSDLGITVKPANGLGDAESLLKGPNFPVAWSSDGRFLIFQHHGVKTRMDVWALPTFGDRKEYLLLNSEFDELTPRLSTDGRWLAYSADDTGNYEIYVQSFSADGKLGADRKRVSTTGGRFPVWRRDGSELFYVADDGQMMASAVKTSGTQFEFAAPKALFKTRMLLRSQNFHEFDVSPDGQKFLIGTLIGDTKAQPPTVVLNWPALLKK